MLTEVRVQWTVRWGVGGWSSGEACCSSISMRGETLHIGLLEAFQLTESYKSTRKRCLKYRRAVTGLQWTRKIMPRTIGSKWRKDNIVWNVLTANANGVNNFAYIVHISLRDREMWHVCRCTPWHHISFVNGTLPYRDEVVQFQQNVLIDQILGSSVTLQSVSCSVSAQLIQVPAPSSLLISRVWIVTVVEYVIREWRADKLQWLWKYRSLRVVEK